MDFNYLRPNFTSNPLTAFWASIESKNKYIIKELKQTGGSGFKI